RPRRVAPRSARDGPGIAKGPLPGGDRPLARDAGDPRAPLPLEPASGPGDRRRDPARDAGAVARAARRGARAGRVPRVAARDDGRVLRRRRCRDRRIHAREVVRARSGAERASARVAHAAREVKEAPMEPSLAVALWWLVFGGTHVGLATAPARRAIVDRIGQRGFEVLYVAVAVV